MLYQVCRIQSSEIGHIKAGIPQGAVLGPLIFLIYINDIIEGTSSDIKLFADDTALFVEVDDPNIAAGALNGNLDKIKLWTEQWLVKFSTDKFKSRLITCSFRFVNHPDIVFNSVVLPEFVHLNISV